MIGKGRWIKKYWMLEHPVFPMGVLSGVGTTKFYFIFFNFIFQGVRGSGVVVEGARRLESLKNSSSFFGARNFQFLNFFGVDFFIFLNLDLKSAQLAPYITTLYHVCLIINTCQSLNLLIPYKQWSKAIRWDS